MSSYGIALVVAETCKGQLNGRQVEAIQLQVVQWTGHSSSVMTNRSATKLTISLVFLSQAHLKPHGHLVLVVLENHALSTVFLAF